MNQRGKIERSGKQVFAILLTRAKVVPEFLEDHNHLPWTDLASYCCKSLSPGASLTLAHMCKKVIVVTLFVCLTLSLSDSFSVRG